MTEKQSRALQDDLRNKLDAKGIYGAVRVVPARSKKGGMDVQLTLKLDLKVLLPLADIESLLDSRKTTRSFLSAVLSDGQVYQVAQAVEE